MKSSLPGKVFKNIIHQIFTADVVPDTQEITVTDHQIYEYKGIAKRIDVIINFGKIKLIIEVKTATALSSKDKSQIQIFSALNHYREQSNMVYGLIVIRDKWILTDHNGTIERIKTFDQIKENDFQMLRDYIAYSINRNTVYSPLYQTKAAHNFSNPDLPQSIIVSPEDEQKQSYNLEVLNYIKNVEINEIQKSEDKDTVIKKLNIKNDILLKFSMFIEDPSKMAQFLDNIFRADGTIADKRQFLIILKDILTEYEIHNKSIFNKIGINVFQSIKNYADEEASEALGEPFIQLLDFLVSKLP